MDSPAADRSRAVGEDAVHEGGGGESSSGVEGLPHDARTKESTMLTDYGKIVDGGAAWENEGRENLEVATAASEGEDRPRTAGSLGASRKKMSEEEIQKMGRDELLAACGLNAEWKFQVDPQRLEQEVEALRVLEAVEAVCRAHGRLVPGDMGVGLGQKGVHKSQGRTAALASQTPRGRMAATDPQTPLPSAHDDGSEGEQKGSQSMGMPNIEVPPSVMCVESSSKNNAYAQDPNTRTYDGSTSRPTRPDAPSYVPSSSKRGEALGELQSLRKGSGTRVDTRPGSSSASASVSAGAAASGGEESSRSRDSRLHSADFIQSRLPSHSQALSRESRLHSAQAQGAVEHPAEVAREDAVVGASLTMGSDVAAVDISKVQPLAPAPPLCVDDFNHVVALVPPSTSRLGRMLEASLRKKPGTIGTGKAAGGSASQETGRTPRMSRTTYGNKAPPGKGSVSALVPGGAYCRFSTVSTFTPHDI